MSLCRHYVRELRRSVLLETPEPEKFDASDSPGLGPNGAGPSGHSYPPEGVGPENDQRLSAFLRSEGRTSGYSARTSVESGQSDRRFSTADRPRRVSDMFPQHHNNNSNSSPGHTVARSDIRASAVRILYTYLLPGSEREVVLPENVVGDIVQLIEQDGRDDPEVFDTAKDYVFQAMERDAFPGFLQAKALGNLVPPSILARLVLALTSAYFLSSYQYRIDPILAFIGFSEYTFMNWTAIREPYVRSLLLKRASVSLAFAVVIAVALCVLFIFVPGTRL
ncbi:Bud site selection protein, Revert to axial protein 1 [Emydomyces testavorans]|uniref:Bud site selection protein, Revert to axial protein 1 n=1 Tax=Emydomyces testavorans TaxID=2070801 RepID=A0AAF0DGB6_9EURO|nr:Bud site selection protein, Revert to axial protein 1 [Emydomyces testavorans]